MTWTQRNLVTNTANVYEYYAVCPVAVSNEAITVNLKIKDNGIIVAFSVTGADTTAIFDGAGVTGTGSSTTPSLSYTTANSSDFLFGIVGVYSDATTGTVGSGFTIIQQGNIASGSGKAAGTLFTEYEISGAAGSYTVNATIASSGAWAMIVDAISAPVTAFSTSLTDTNSLTDNSISFLGKYNFLEGLSLADTISILQKMFLSDAISLVDISAVLKSILGLNLSDSLSATESKLFAGQKIMQLETAILSELKTADISKSYSDNLLLTLSNISEIYKTFSESYNINSLLQLNAVIEKLDSLDLADLKSVNIFKTYIDNISLLSSNIIDIHKILIDLYNVNTLLQLNVIIEKSDVATLTDSITFQTVVLIVKTLADSISISDTYKSFISFLIHDSNVILDFIEPINIIKSITDNIILSEYLSYLLERLLTDVFQVIDITLPTGTKLLTLTDVISIIDNFITELTVMRDIVMNILAGYGFPVSNLARIKSLDTQRTNMCVVIPTNMRVETIGFYSYLVSEDFLVKIYVQDRETYDKWRNTIENQIVADFLKGTLPIVQGQLVLLEVSRLSDTSVEKRGIYSADYLFTAQYAVT